MKDIQVGDGFGIEQFEIEELLCSLGGIFRSAKIGKADPEELKKILFRAIQLNIAMRGYRDEVVVGTKDFSATFPASIFGPPIGVWKQDSPEFYGNFWLLKIGDKEPRVAHYEHKGWRDLDGNEIGDGEILMNKVIDSRHILGWKPLRGSN